MTLPRKPNFARYLHDARMKRGLSVVKVAEQVGVSTASIYFWENDRFRPRDDNLLAFRGAETAYQGDPRDGSGINSDVGTNSTPPGPKTVAGLFLPHPVLSLGLPTNLTCRRTAPNTPTTRNLLRTLSRGIDAGLNPDR